MSDFTRTIRWLAIVSIELAFITTLVGCDKLSQLNLPITSQSAPGVTATLAVEQTSETAISVNPTTLPEGPEKTVTDRCQALIKKDFNQAANLFSEYSLRLFDLTRQDIVMRYQTLDFKGWKLVDCRRLESKKFDDQTILIHLLMKEQTGEQEPQYYDGWQALRLEEGQWLINWNDVIDTLPMAVESQTVNGVTLQPTQLIRYTDKIRLLFNVGNANKRAAFWDLAGQKVATFKIADQTVIVRGMNETPFRIDAENTYTGAYAEVPGLQTVYPTGVDLTNWTWPDAKNPNIPNLEGQMWSFQFEFQVEATPVP
jgi:hypothetical protein